MPAANVLNGMVRAARGDNATPDEKYEAHQLRDVWSSDNVLTCSGRSCCLFRRGDSFVEDHGINNRDQKTCHLNGEVRSGCFSSGMDSLILVLMYRWISPCGQELRSIWLCRRSTVKCNNSKNGAVNEVAGCSGMRRDS